jgi:Tat protein translocase TatB subunit
MFGIGLPELVIIIIVALLVVGPARLPEVARSLGKALGEFRRLADDVKETIEHEMTAEEEKKAEPGGQKEEEKEQPGAIGEKEEEKLDLRRAKALKGLRKNPRKARVPMNDRSRYDRREEALHRSSERAERQAGDQPCRPWPRLYRYL